MLDGEEGKKMTMKKMMVRERRAGLWHWGGEGAGVLSPPTEEAGGGVGAGGGLKWEEDSRRGGTLGLESAPPLTAPHLP